MAILPQKSLFDWTDIDLLGDLHRLRLVLDHLPDETLMVCLEDQRGNGRDDYPVRAMWNSVVAGVVFQHPSIQTLRRELSRNAQLLTLCGFDPLRSTARVPPPWAYTRFLKTLIKQNSLIEEIFKTLVGQLSHLLPSFGSTLAIDGKAIDSHGNPPKSDKLEHPDGRRDLDADWGVKSYSGVSEDGSLWKKVKSWFGYRIHFVVDADYELPVAFNVTKASTSEVKQAHRLVDQIDLDHGDLLKGCDTFLADRGYDDGKLINKCWRDHQIKPVIDIRNLWKDKQETRLIEHTENIVYDFQGTVSCVCLQSGDVKQMAYAGFEKDRNTLKYRCPARHYGVECKGQATCGVSTAIRIPLATDSRIFTPCARSSYSWKTLYNKRSSVERVNSRLAGSYGFETHFTRGLEKMKLKMGVALCTMLAMAVGRIKEKQYENMRSLVA